MNSLSVSVVVATYNCEGFIAGALRSLQQQHPGGYELIVVDGGSTDRTIQRVDELHPGITIISEPDRGIYDAWNKGIRAARGRWVTFLGADDRLRPGALQLASNAAAAATDCNLVAGLVELWDSNGPVRTVGKPFCAETLCSAQGVAMVGALFSRELLEKSGGFDHNYKSAGDHDWFARNRNEIRAAFVPEVLGEMTVGGTSDRSLRPFREVLCLRILHFRVPPIAALGMYFRDVSKWVVRRRLWY